VSTPTSISKDLDPHCREALLGHTGIEHVFGDLLAQFVELRGLEAQQRLAFLANLESEVRLRIMSGFSWDRSPYCFLHQRCCRVDEPTVLVGGTPCVDHSQAGARRRDNGLSIVIFLAFCLKIIAMEIPIAIHENVSEFPESCLHRMLGHKYHIVSIVIHTAFVSGCHVSRKRRYTLCFHKRKTRFLCDPLVLYRAITGQLALIRPSISELYLASRDELVAEACLPNSGRRGGMRNDSGQRTHRC
jgi:hypothetical protein